MAVIIYCAQHRTNHRLRQRDAEDALQALVAELTTEQAEGNVHSLRQPDDDPAWKLTAEYCVLEELPNWRSELLAEHLEAMRERRRGCQSVTELPA